MNNTVFSCILCFFYIKLLLFSGQIFLAFFIDWRVVILLLVLFLYDNCWWDSTIILFFYLFILEIYYWTLKTARLVSVVVVDSFCSFTALELPLLFLWHVQKIGLILSFLFVFALFPSFTVIWTFFFLCPYYFCLMNLEFTPIHFYPVLGPAIRGPGKSLTRGHRADQLPTFRPYPTPCTRDLWIDVCRAPLTLTQTGFQSVAVGDFEILLFSGPVDAPCFSLPPDIIMPYSLVAVGSLLHPLCFGI